MEQNAVQQLIKQSLAAQEERFCSTLNELRSELAAVRADNSLLIAKFCGPSTSFVRPKPCLPDPAKFDGNQLTWDSWFPEIKAKLRIDGDAIGGLEAQFWYLYSRLEGKIQALVAPQLAHAEDNHAYDPQTILDQLVRLNDNPNKQQEAADKLQSLRQGDDSLGAFLVKFERLLYKAQANKWSDDAKISLLRSALGSRVRGRLALQIIVPNDYDGFVKLLQKLEGSGNQGRYHGSDNGSYGQGSSGGGQHDSNKMDIGAVYAVNKKPQSNLAKLQQLLDDDDKADSCC